MLQGQGTCRQSGFAVHAICDTCVRQAERPRTPMHRQVRCAGRGLCCRGRAPAGNGGLQCMQSVTPVCSKRSSRGTPQFMQRPTHVCCIPKHSVVGQCFAAQQSRPQPGSPCQYLSVCVYVQAGHLDKALAVKMSSIQASTHLSAQGSAYAQVAWHKSPFWPCISQLCSRVRAMHQFVV